MVSVLPPNYRLKAKIIEKWGTISAAAGDLGSISELFGEDTLD
jgi:hypothetical protein